VAALGLGRVNQPVPPFIDVLERLYEVPSVFRLPRTGAKTYAETLSQAMQALEAGPEVLGTRARDDIGPGIRTLQLARRGRKARHFVIFLAGAGQVIDVLRLLHDSMDLARHGPFGWG
jgi:toxin ParE1/3/4